MIFFYSNSANAPWYVPLLFVGASLFLQGGWFTPFGPVSYLLASPLSVIYAFDCLEPPVWSFLPRLYALLTSCCPLLLDLQLIKSNRNSILDALAGFEGVGHTLHVKLTTSESRSILDSDDVMCICSLEDGAFP